MFLAQTWNLNMNEIKPTFLPVNLVTDDIILRCCDIFNADFQKVFNGKSPCIYPSRMRKYLVNHSYLNCMWYDDILTGYMITEKIDDDIIWIKQIVIKKEFRNRGLATELVRSLGRYKSIGIITNNPIMIKILRSLGYTVIQEKSLYTNLYENSVFKDITDLYEIESIKFQNDSFVALTHLINSQEIVHEVDITPLKPVINGYEWILLFSR